MKGTLILTSQMSYNRGKSELDLKTNLIKIGLTVPKFVYLEQTLKRDSGTRFKMWIEAKSLC